jgi:hypothetical protein
MTETSVRQSETIMAAPLHSRLCFVHKQGDEARSGKNADLLAPHHEPSVKRGSREDRFYIQNSGLH